TFPFKHCYQKQSGNGESSGSRNITGRVLTQCVDHKKSGYQYSQWSSKQFYNVEGKGSDGAATGRRVTPHIASNQPVMETTQNGGNNPRYYEKHDGLYKITVCRDGPVRTSERGF